MARAPFQCLIIPFMIENNVPKFAIFKRADMRIWQFISGGGEDDEETEYIFQTAHDTLE
ncbi:hypothetical protein [Dethiothermospora halolimnae]|uniref:hypothetical protein n=1 Tax=Dethiothermospora halolimnae TaxID=3114390 RepID=UPI003CCBD288